MKYLQGVNINFFNGKVGVCTESGKSGLWKWADGGLYVTDDVESIDLFWYDGSDNLDRSELIFGNEAGGSLNISISSNYVRPDTNEQFEIVVIKSNPVVFTLVYQFVSPEDSSGIYTFGGDDGVVYSEQGSTVYEYGDYINEKGKYNAMMDSNGLFIKNDVPGFEKVSADRYWTISLMACASNDLTQEMFSFVGYITEDTVGYIQYVPLRNFSIEYKFYDGEELIKEVVGKTGNTYSFQDYLYVAAKYGESYNDGTNDWNYRDVETNSGTIERQDYQGRLAAMNTDISSYDVVITFNYDLVKTEPDPVESEPPIESEPPVPSESPQSTEEPVESPQPSEEPVPTDEPVPTEEPIETPKVTEEPVITPAPYYSPSTLPPSPPPQDLPDDEVHLGDFPVTPTPTPESEVIPEDDITPIPTTGEDVVIPEEEVPLGDYSTPKTGDNRTIIAIIAGILCLGSILGMCLMKFVIK